MAEEAMEIMLHFVHLKLPSAEIEGSLIFCTGRTWKQLYNSSRCTTGRCGNVSPFIILKPSFPLIKPAQILEQYKL
jgi:hypothetical protein